MATSIYSSLSCLLPFYTIPIFPLFKSKDFSFTCLLPLFRCTLHITFLFYSLRNIYIALGYLLLCYSIVLCMHGNFHCYNLLIWALSLLQLLIWGIFIWTDCLRLFIVVYKLNILFMMCCITCVYRFSCH